MTIILFLLVLAVLIFVHELGHFLMARRKGVLVEEFAFGFPPRLWSKKKGDTVYAINLIPLGGYVKLYGEQGEDKEDRKSFAGKGKKDKALILVSGVMMNIFLAYIILVIGYGFGMKSFIPGMGDYKEVQNNQTVKITDIESDSPASKEGLQKGDQILKVEGKKINIEAEVLGLINQKSFTKTDNKIELEIKRGEEVLIKKIETFEEKIKTKDDKEVNVRRIGISIEGKGFIKSAFYMAPVVAAKETVRLTGLTLVGIFDLFKDLVTKFTVSEKVTGPVGIYKVTGIFADFGFMAVLQFIAILSISLAVINILPIPALDGGNLFVLALEKIFKREFSDKAKGIATAVGFLLLISLIIVLTIRDITRF